MDTPRTRSPRRKLLWVLAPLALIPLLAPTAVADSLEATEIAVIDDPDPDDGGSFGTILAFDEGTLMVPGDGDTVHVYDVAQDGSVSDRDPLPLPAWVTGVGNVVLEGSRAYVHVSGDQGRALQYDRAQAGWELTRTVPLPSGVDSAAISFFGDLLLTRQNNRIDVFRLSDGGDYVFEARLVAPRSSGPSPNYGSSVAVSGDRIIVGHQGWTNGTPRSTGAAHVYIRSGQAGWVFDQTLLASDADEFGRSFGYDVAASDSVVVVEDPFWDDSTFPGAAYFFVPGSDGLQETSQYSGHSVRGEFFYSGSLDADADLVVAGAVQEADADPFGRASVFVPDGNGAYSTSIPLSSNRMEDRENEFGWDVAIDEQIVIVGDPWDGSRRDDGPEGEAAVHVFRLDRVRDADDDGVPDADDDCPDTVLPDVPTRSHRAGRLIATQDGFVWRSGRVAFSLAATGGCSGAQISEAAGLTPTHQRYGLTQDVLRTWVTARALGR